MKKMILLACLSLIFTMATQAQNRISGKVTDVKNAAIPFVNVSLMSQDSALITGSTTDDNGKFKLAYNNTKVASYLLRISYVGYVTQYIQMKNLNHSVDMGTIVLDEVSQQLGEVQVTGNAVVHKVDRMLLFPTESALKNAYNPYDLLFNMSIPHLQVNALSKSLSANGGSVQLRINGVKASQAEVTALLPKDIVRFEMIENPGERYGDETLGAVLNIIVRHREAGGLVNAQLTNSPMLPFGEDFLTAKYNYGKSQWGVNYSLSYRDFRKIRTDKSETFNLADETIRRVQEGVNDRKKSNTHDIDFSYNYSEPDKYVFNAVFRNNIIDAPFQGESNKLYDASDASHYILSKIKNSSSSYSPALDLYYQRNLPKQQVLTLNVTGTLIHSTSDRNYFEQTVENVPLADITTNVSGNKRSVIGEAIYDKRFKKITLSGGLRHYQMYAKNQYSGSSPVTSEMNQMRSSAFAELQGNLKKVSYGVSVGMTRSYFKESGESHTYYTFTPTVKVAFAPHKNGYLSYRFNTSPQIPSLSSLTNVEQYIDTIQISRGNPNLKTYNVYNNNLNYSFNKGKFVFMTDVTYSYKDNCIMENVFAEGNHLVIMDDNQRSYQSLQVGPTFIFRGLDLLKLKNFLTLSLECGFARYWSNGNNYTHTYNNFYYNAQFAASYKSFALLGQFSKNRNTLMGETIFKGENQTVLLANWSHKNLQLAVGMLFPFTNNYKTGLERVSKVAPNSSWTYAKETGQLLVLKLSYNFEFGRQYNSIRKRTNNSDSDSGILKM